MKKRCIFLRVFIIILLFVSLFTAFKVDGVIAQTRSFEFAGALVSEVSLLHTFREDRGVYLFGVVGTTAGVLFVDKLFLHKGGSISKLIFGAASGTLAVVFISGILNPEMIGNNDLPKTGNVYQILGFSLFVSVPVLSAVYEYNRSKKPGKALLEFNNRKIQFIFTTPHTGLIYNGLLKESDKALFFKLVQIDF